MRRVCQGFSANNLANLPVTSYRCTSLIWLSLVHADGRRSPGRPEPRSRLSPSPAGLNITEHRMQTTHRFKIGKTVRFTPAGRDRSVPAGNYQVTRLLPPDGID